MARFRLAAALLVSLSLLPAPSWGQRLGPKADPAAEQQAGDLAAQREQTVAVAKARQRAVVSLGKRTLETLTAAAAESTRWPTEVEPLLTNEKGRAIAADDSLVKSFRLVFDRERPSASEIADARVRVEALLGPVEKAADDPVSTLDPGKTEATLKEEDTKAKAMLAAYKTSREQLAAIASRADASKAGTKTLQEALDAARGSEQLAALEREQAVTGDLDAKVRAKEEELARRKAQQRLDELEGEAQKTELEALAKRQDVQDRYQPFLARGRYPGHRVNNTRSWLYNEAWKIPAPISLSRITSAGALSNPEVFVAIACGQGRYPNDRPKWPAPTTLEQQKEYAARMDEFRKLAPVWLQMELLSK